VKEQVDHPSHYQSACGLEAIDVIEAFNLGFVLGNAVKYILRAGKKGRYVDDIKKAKWYLDRAIANAENGMNGITKQFVVESKVAPKYVPTVEVPTVDLNGVKPDLNAPLHVKVTP